MAGIPCDHEAPGLDSVVQHMASSNPERHPAPVIGARTVSPRLNDDDIPALGTENMATLLQSATKALHLLASNLRDTSSYPQDLAAGSPAADPVATHPASTAEYPHSVVVATATELQRVLDAIQARCRDRTGPF